MVTVTPSCAETAAEGCTGALAHAPGEGLCSSCRSLVKVTSCSNTASLDVASVACRAGHGRHAAFCEAANCPFHSKLSRVFRGFRFAHGCSSLCKAAL